MILLVGAIAAFGLTGCDKDDDDNDLTIKVVGTYQGTYEESNDFGSIEFEDITTVVTRESSDRINLQLILIPGVVTINFKGDMTSDTEFTIPEFTYDSETYSGSGSLENENTLTFMLEDQSSTNAQGTYNGTRQ